MLHESPGLAFGECWFFLIYCTMTKLKFLYCNTTGNLYRRHKWTASFWGLIDSLWVWRLRFDPAESAAYVVNISMWECCSLQTHPGCVTADSGVAARSLYFGGNGSGFLPKRTRVDPVLQAGCSLLFQNFILGTDAKKKKKVRFHPRGKYLHHLIRRVWNHNACQMNKWCCGMWKSVVFSENIHGPWRLIPQSCCLSKLPQPKFWVTTKACFLCQDNH